MKVLFRVGGRFKKCIFEGDGIEIGAFKCVYPDSSFLEIGPEIDISFNECEFINVKIVENNSAKGKYNNCTFVE